MQIMFFFKYFEEVNFVKETLKNQPMWFKGCDQFKNFYAGRGKSHISIWRCFWSTLHLGNREVLHT